MNVAQGLYADKLPPFPVAPENALLARRAYEVGYMGGAIRSALAALEYGNREGAIEHLNRALEEAGQ